MLYYSEHGQDRWLDEEVFQGQRHGIFVEVGALDGLSFSNTRFFEENRGWSGVLIEANPVAFANMVVGPVESRPKSRKICCALGETWRLAEFSSVHRISGWSGLDAERHALHAKRIAGLSPEKTRFTVPIVPISCVLAHCGITRIDYLSIDVEGAELLVLRGLVRDLFEIDIIEVENNYGGAAVETLLAEHGYEKFHTIDINDFYRPA